MSSTSDMPTPAQAEYLRRAMKAHLVGRSVSLHGGVFFFLSAMGRLNTGKACCRRGWITRRGFGLYQITYEGVEALDRYSGVTLEGG